MDTFLPRTQKILQLAVLKQPVVLSGGTDQENVSSNPISEPSKTFENGEFCLHFMLLY